MKDEGKMKVSEFVNFILEHMTAEEALTKLLKSQMNMYEALIENSEGTMHVQKGAGDDRFQNFSPIFAIMEAAKMMGWAFGFPKLGKDSDPMRGIVVGDEKFIDEVFEGEFSSKKKKKKDDDKKGGTDESI